MDWDIQELDVDKQEDVDRFFLFTQQLLLKSKTLLDNSEPYVACSTNNGNGLHYDVTDSKQSQAPPIPAPVGLTNREDSNKFFNLEVHESIVEQVSGRQLDNSNVMRRLYNENETTSLIAANYRQALTENEQNEYLSKNRYRRFINQEDKEAKNDQQQGRDDHHCDKNIKKKCSLEAEESTSTAKLSEGNKGENSPIAKMDTNENETQIVQIKDEPMETQNTDIASNDASSFALPSTTPSYQDEHSFAMATVITARIAHSESPLHSASTTPITCVNTQIARVHLASVPDLTTITESSINNNKLSEEDESSIIKEEPCSHTVEAKQANETIAAADDTSEEFCWTDHLEITGAIAAPQDCFPHVEQSIRSLFRVGHVVEVSLGIGNSENDGRAQQKCYWFAEVVVPCGQLLGLRYVVDGFEPKNLEDEDEEEEEEDDDEKRDVRCDVWLDAFAGRVHPLGWSSLNGYKLQPPQGIASKVCNMECLVQVVRQSAHTPSAELFDLRLGTTTVDLFPTGVLLECREELSPHNVWLVRVLENVGGRLLLRYEGAEKASHDFWLFYLHWRLHEVGWAQIVGLEYCIPQALADHIGHDEKASLLERCLKECEGSKLGYNIFEREDELEPHTFREGMKLEAIHPQRKCVICPATVHEVIDQYFFIIAIDDLDVKDSSRKVFLCCHNQSPNIFPVRWCAKNGIRLNYPNGWKKAEFDWKEYLQDTDSESAPDRAFHLTVPDHGFERGMKLEAVNPDLRGQLCAATVIRVVDHLLWIHLDCATEGSRTNHIVSVTLYDLFPVGWCQSNNYPLKPPRFAIFKSTFLQDKTFSRPMTAKQYRLATYNIMQTGSGPGFCPTIYLNHRCFSGAFLSKARVAELPSSVGPGPIILVIKQVLRMLISAGYKTTRVLRELQLEGAANPNMFQTHIKTKYKRKSYRATVEICTSRQQLEEYLRQVCIKLECCPLLVATNTHRGVCPEGCSQLTKSKYTAQYMGKSKPGRKPGRPPGSFSSHIMDGYQPKKRGRKKKKKRGRKSRAELELLQAALAAGGGVDAESVAGSVASSEKYEEDYDNVFHRSNSLTASSHRRGPKRKYDKRVMPPSEMRTRGVKLPAYGQGVYPRRGGGMVDGSFSAVAPKRYRSASGYDSRCDSSLSGFAQNQRLFDKLSIDIPSDESNLWPHCKSNNATERRESDGWLANGHAADDEIDLIYGSSTVCLFKGEVTLKLNSNPLYWSVQEVVDFIKSTDSAQFARILMDQEIDGQALLLLSLPTVQEYMEYRLGPAVKLCHHIERLKLAFFQQYA